MRLFKSFVTSYKQKCHYSEAQPRPCRSCLDCVTYLSRLLAVSKVELTICGQVQSNRSAMCWWIMGHGLHNGTWSEYVQADPRRKIGLFSLKWLIYPEYHINGKIAEPVLFLISKRRNTQIFHVKHQLFVATFMILILNFSWPLSWSWFLASSIHNKLTYAQAQCSANRPPRSFYSQMASKIIFFWDPCQFHRFLVDWGLFWFNCIIYLCNIAFWEKYPKIQR